MLIWFPYVKKFLSLVAIFHSFFHGTNYNLCQLCSIWPTVLPQTLAYTSPVLMSVFPSLMFHFPLLKAFQRIHSVQILVQHSGFLSSITKSWVSPAFCLSATAYLLYLHLPCTSGGCPLHLQPDEVLRHVAKGVINLDNFW
jgi:hypothetical protein